MLQALSMQLLTNIFKLGQFPQFILHLVVSIFKLIGFLSLSSGNAVDLFLFLTLGVEVIFKILVFVFSCPQFSVDIFKIAVDFVDCIFKLRYNLFILLHLRLIIFVFVDLRI